MRPPVDTIAAPPFPSLEWVNTDALPPEEAAPGPMLVEFFDFCRLSSLHTLPYVQRWHERYGGDGLRVISVHAPGYAPSQDPAAARSAVERLGIAHAVALDQELALWRLYDNRGWPARYLFDERGMLSEYHYGEGAYAETEAAIQELLGTAREPVAPLRPQDDPDALLVVPSPTEEQPGTWSGPYAAGAVHAVLDGRGSAVANGREIAVTHPGCYPLIEHAVHTEGVLGLELTGGVTCHAVVFSPGLAPTG